MSKNKGNKKSHQYNNNYKKSEAKPSTLPQAANLPASQAARSSKPAAPINFSTPVTLSFQATDTLFFRESRPMESMGELQSVFPPPIRTLAGALRTLIGETTGVNWQDYEKDANHSLRSLIGFSDDLGKLKLEGAWLAWKGERLYPAPLHLLKKGEHLFTLSLDKNTVWCDLGRHVRLPKLLDGDAPKGSKPLENAWLTGSALQKVLNGNQPSLERPTPDKPNAKQEIFFAKDLFERESRLGIGRDNATGMVRDGVLYQTQHIRPKAELSIELDVQGLSQGDLPEYAMLRLGGEGRTAHIALTQASNKLPTGKAGKEGLVLYLLTPLPINWQLGADNDWQPLPGFIAVPNSNPSVWRGQLNGIELELHGAVTGKALREGGWDMAKHAPRAVSSFIPAGSLFFCKLINSHAQAAIEALHDQHIGTLTEYGYGHVAVGVWND